MDFLGAASSKPSGIPLDFSNGPFTFQLDMEW
jgi:hypothetical protein